MAGGAPATIACASSCASWRASVAALAIVACGLLLRLRGERVNLKRVQTRLAVSEIAGSTTSLERLKISTTVRMRKRCPLTSSSATNSSANKFW